MKPARIVVLLIALAAGGIAALLAGRSDPPRTGRAGAGRTTRNRRRAGRRHRHRPRQPCPAATCAGRPGRPPPPARNFIRKNDRPDAINQLAGSIARSPFFAGEPIREARLIKGKGSGYMAAILPSGMRAISTDITPETGAAGFILPNDHVDVILSRRDREAEKAAGVEVHTSETILTNVRVLAIDQTVEEKGGQRVVVGKTATLELTQRQAETLVMSRTAWAQLSLALRSLVDFEGDKTEAPATTSGRRNGINIVRFGVTTIDDAEIAGKTRGPDMAETPLIRTTLLVALIVAFGLAAAGRAPAADPRPAGHPAWRRATPARASFRSASASRW